MAEASGWLKIANKDTTDGPEVVLTGDPVWASGLGDAPAWTTPSQTVSRLTVGQRYTYPTDGMAARVRFWLPAGTENMGCELWWIHDPLGLATLRPLVPSFIIQANDLNQWNTLPINELIAVGSVFDVLMSVQSLADQFTWDGRWDYRVTNASPLPGEIIHPPPGRDFLVSLTDYDDADRTVDLDRLKPGDQIEGGAVTWTITSIETVADYKSIAVTPSTTTIDGLHTFNFTEYGARLMPNVEIANHYVAEPQVQGFKTTTGYDPAITLNENAYGLDIEYQEATGSPDWDFLAWTK